MALLEEKQAKELFMFYAFKHVNLVTNDFKVIYVGIIKVSRGLPLSHENWVGICVILVIWKYEKMHCAN